MTTPPDDTARCVCSEPYTAPEPTCPVHGCQHEPDDTETDREGVDWHWGTHPAHGFLTKHVGPRERCSGPDCGPDDTTEPKRIQLRRTKGWRKPEGAVVVTRSSKLWGNPFRIGSLIPEPWSLTAKYEGRVVEDRHMAVDLFESYTQITPFYVELIRKELAGKDVCCVCPLDEPCHGDVHLRIANEERP